MHWVTISPWFLDCYFFLQGSLLKCIFSEVLHSFSRQSCVSYLQRPQPTSIYFTRTIIVSFFVSLFCLLMISLKAGTLPCSPFCFLGAIAILERKEREWWGKINKIKCKMRGREVKEKTRGKRHLPRGSETDKTPASSFKLSTQGAVSFPYNVLYLKS